MHAIFLMYVSFLIECIIKNKIENFNLNTCKSHMWHFIINHEMPHVLYKGFYQQPSDPPT
jgi:hypothetical protein